MEKSVTRLGNESIVMKFYKKERWCWEHGYFTFSKIIWRLIYILFSCQIPPTAKIHETVDIAHGIGIVIHQESVIGEYTKIYQHVTIGGGHGPRIGRNCVLGSGCCILGNVIIGDNVKVGANAVVLENIPSNCTVVGVPARIVKRENIKS